MSEQSHPRYSDVESHHGRCVKAVELTVPQYAQMGAGVRLAQSLGAPEGARVHQVVQQPLRGSVVVVIAHPGYPEVPWFAEAPCYRPGAAQLGKLLVDER